MSLKEFAHYSYIIKFVSKELFVVFLYCLINDFGICSEGPFFISTISN